MAKDKKAEKKAETPKDPYKKYIGKKTNEGDKITAVFPKNIRPNEKFVEVRTEKGTRTIVSEEELKTIAK